MIAVNAAGALGAMLAMLCCDDLTLQLGLLLVYTSLFCTAHLSETRR